MSTRTAPKIHAPSLPYRKEAYDYNVLCDLLNGTEEDLGLLIAASSCAYEELFPGPDSDPNVTWGDYPPELEEAFEEWREAGMPEPEGLPIEAQLVHDFPADFDRLWELQQTALQIATSLCAKRRLPRLPIETQKMLTAIANYPVPFHAMESSAKGPVRVRLVWTGHHEFMSMAVRALWGVMLGHAELRQCEAPAPRPSGCSHLFDERCGRWFVRGGGEGRPRKHCSDTCAKRAERERRRKARHC